LHFCCSLVVKESDNVRKGIIALRLAALLGSRYLCRFLSRGGCALHTFEQTGPGVGALGFGALSALGRSLLCLLLGIFLFVPGLMKPKELLVPLLAGAIGIGAGIGGLWRNRKNRKTPFETSAALLFKSIGSIASVDGIRILFSDLCMMLSSENIAYENFEGVFISRDLYLFTYGEKALLLQKKDLTDADPCAFEDFLAEKFKVLYRI